jgi:hypothetical protein
MEHNEEVGRQVPGNRQNIGRNCPKLLIACKNYIIFRTTIFFAAPPVDDQPRGGTEMAAGSSGQPMLIGVHPPASDFCESPASPCGAFACVRYHTGNSSESARWTKPFCGGSDDRARRRFRSGSAGSLRDFVVRNEVVSGGDELYAIVAELWPELLHKAPPAIVDALMRDQSPTCPNCGRVMKLKERPGTPKHQHIFKCEVCNLVFMTQDHLLVSG